MVKHINKNVVKAEVVPAAVTVPVVENDALFDIEWAKRSGQPLPSRFDGLYESPEPPKPVKPVKRRAGGVTVDQTFVIRLGVLKGLTDDQIRNGLVNFTGNNRKWATNRHNLYRKYYGTKGETDAKLVTVKEAIAQGLVNPSIINFDAPSK